MIISRVRRQRADDTTMRGLRARPLYAAAVLAALSLAGCSTFSDVADKAPGVQISVFEPSVEPTKAPVLVIARERRPVASVEGLEIGALHDGVMLTAHGHAPEADWFSPQLEARRGGLPGPDGFIDFDFVAAPPALNDGEQGPVGTEMQRRVRGDVAVPASALSGAAGLRVFSAGGAVAARL
ncbi:MAG: hypothetical protein ACJA1L_000060 [Paracoccaceae bacterium]|jgi:hypothetical protein